MLKEFFLPIFSLELIILAFVGVHWLFALRKAIFTLIRVAETSILFHSSWWGSYKYLSTPLGLLKARKLFFSIVVALRKVLSLSILLL